MRQKQNNCLNIGTYPKWIGRIVAWYLKKRLPKGVRIKLYGRGKGSSQKNYGALPVRLCSKVAIYFYFYDNALETYRKLYYDTPRNK